MSEPAGRGRAGARPTRGGGGQGGGGHANARGRARPARGGGSERDDFDFVASEDCSRTTTWSRIRATTPRRFEPPDAGRSVSLPRRGRRPRRRRRRRPRSARLRGGRARREWWRLTILETRRTWFRRAFRDPRGGRRAHGEGYVERGARGAGRDERGVYGVGWDQNGRLRRGAMSVRARGVASGVCETRRVSGVARSKPVGVLPGGAGPAQEAE